VHSLAPRTTRRIIGRAMPVLAGIAAGHTGD